MNILSTIDLQALLGCLYDAVTAPTGFQDFIETLCHAFQSKSVTMMTRNEITHDINGLWVYGTSLDSYVREYSSEDMLAQHIMTEPIALFYASNLDVPNPENFPSTRFYQEWLVPQGIAYATGATVLREGNWLTQLYLQRSPDHAPFTRDDIDRLNELVPHLQRAIQMRQRFTELQLEQNVLVSSLDVWAMPTVLFDEHCRVVHANRSSELLLKNSRDCWIDGGHIFARDLQARRSLNLELTKTIRASHGETIDPGDVVLLHRSARLPLILMFTPLRLSGNTMSQGAALMFIFDPEKRPAITVDLVKRLFGLSKSEAELAVALCCGKTLADAASERDASIHTIRSQLKSIFGKTGTNRQAHLVSLLLSSPAFFIAENSL